jgi:tryptophanyl-tRNA synthetase
MANTHVLSGIRSSGTLHLGNYLGALKNWQALQHQYECYFFIADWHALTTDYADTDALKEHMLDNMAGFLAVGLDPEKCTLFIQSRVPEHAVLHLLLSMFTPVPWLERVPSYKEQQQQIQEKDLSVTDRRHHHLQSELRAGGTRSGSPYRAVAGHRQAIQSSVYTGVPRTSAAADRDAEGAGAGRAENEQEL